MVVRCFITAKMLRNLVAVERKSFRIASKMLRDPQFQMAKETKTVLIIAFLYIISPIDVIPDAIPLLGLLDDVLVAGYALRQAAAELERYRRHLQTTQGAAVRQ